MHAIPRVFDAGTKVASSIPQRSSYKRGTSRRRRPCLRVSEPRSVDLERYRRNAQGKFWISGLCPCLPTTAPPHGKSGAQLWIWVAGHYARCR